MNMAVSKDELPAKPKRCYGSLGVGAILAGIALAAVSVDYSNNTHFGEKVSPELGMVMGLAAIALTALPAAAATLGRWDWQLKSGTMFCVVLTVIAALSAYTDKQGKDILARKGEAEAYRMAQADAAAARQEISEARAAADRITETASIADLEAMAKLQRELIEKETNDRGGCGKRCRDAEDALKAIILRVPAARAKAEAVARAEEAQARLDQAQKAQSAGPAEQTMLASVIGSWVSHDPADVARWISLTITAFSIAATLILALVTEKSVLLIMRGLAFKPISHEIEDVKPVAVTIIPPRRMGRKPKKPTGDELLRMFVTEFCKPGEGETTGGEMHEAFDRFWTDRADGLRKPSNVVVSQTLATAGIKKGKRGGRVRYAAKVEC